MKKNIIFIVLMLGSAVLPAIAHTQQYLDFLYRYMALPDSADYSPEFYRQNVELAVKARQEMPWGKLVPEREFRHFVLPVRVNNEHLDRSREVFYEQLKPRVKGMSMSQAVLEVNHWCHEHVTYRPSDARTSSPLATVRTAYGRCGEESTLLVAALRAVGIPARQVYTPRWAHTDDNHAWVEAWADGAWHFLGACEPEPVLDLGWFNESASRAMLMHTKVYGHYDGPEEVVSLTDCYTEINITANYAPTARLDVQVLDEHGLPAAGALVEFKLYNYAEFYTVASKATDTAGHASLTAGRGDLLVWASQGGKMAAKRASVGTDHLITLRLGTDSLPESCRLDVVPPAASGQLPVVTEAQRRENNRRLAHEDSLRRAYEATMPVEEWRGNHSTIKQFLEQAPNQFMAQKLLSVISAKDLRDVELSVLQDNQVSHTDTSYIYLHYVLNPRVENEWLTPYKAVLRQQLASIDSPEALAMWCRRNINVVKPWRTPDGALHGPNPQQLRQQPLSVYRTRKTDALGRNIFFVAAARSLGWPARINEVDGRLQYFRHNTWIDVDFEQKTTLQATASTRKVTLGYELKSPYVDDPKYYIHFTLSRIVDGRTQLLTYPEEATWQHDFAQGTQLEPGEYLLTTGTRMANGKVLSHLSRFTVDSDHDKWLPITLHESSQDLQVIGSLNAENAYHNIASDTDASLLSTTGRGYYVLAIVAPNHEPTNHTLRDIAACKDQLEQWGRKMVILLEGADEAQRFNYAEFAGLPSTVVWGIDKQGTILKEVVDNMKLASDSRPIFLVCDSFNRVVYLQQGYTIHMGEQLLQVIKKL
ncbi:MAG: transglutaminase domain-containing protein [Muribaculaceae bacterium]|nr:transglutaminase domain-containing protein [Muribaculaceae bacterium]